MVHLAKVMLHVLTMNCLQSNKDCVFIYFLILKSDLHLVLYQMGNNTALPAKRPVLNITTDKWSLEVMTSIDSHPYYVDMARQVRSILLTTDSYADKAKRLEPILANIHTCGKSCSAVEKNSICIYPVLYVGDNDTKQPFCLVHHLGLLHELAPEHQWKNISDISAGIYVCESMNN